MITAGTHAMIDMTAFRLSNMNVWKWKISQSFVIFEYPSPLPLHSTTSYKITLITGEKNKKIKNIRDDEIDQPIFKHQHHQLWTKSRIRLYELYRRQQQDDEIKRHGVHPCRQQNRRVGVGDHAALSVHPFGLDDNTCPKKKKICTRW